MRWPCCTASRSIMKKRNGRLPAVMLAWPLLLVLAGRELHQLRGDLVGRAVVRVVVVGHAGAALDAIGLFVGAGAEAELPRARLLQHVPAVRDAGARAHLLAAHQRLGEPALGAL